MTEYGTVTREGEAYF